jgi:hypothetical protein
LFKRILQIMQLFWQICNMFLPKCGTMYILVPNLRPKAIQDEYAPIN